MATQIAYCHVGQTQNGNLTPVPVGASVVSEEITASGSNQQSAVNAGFPFVRICTDEDPVFIAIGTSPDATVTTGRFMIPASTVDYYAIIAGQRVAVVAA